MTIPAAVAIIKSDLSPKEKGCFIYEKQTAINSGAYAFLNLKSNILNNKDLRKAIQKGIDLTELRSLVGDELALDYPILKTQIELSEWPSLPERNLDEAREIIKNANLGDATLNLVTISTGYFPTLAEDFAAQLEDLGFKVNKTI
ncbi:MAG: hypothetical protein IJK97_09960, partial [Thermoguttaceae bacterium]|nr:hypothetical protein [Thermoguttaceae bacterium]